jgi:hypothetical protein
MTTLLRQQDYCELTLENLGRSPHNAKIPNSEEVDQIYVRVLDYSAPVRVFPFKPSRSTESTGKNRFYDVILILLVSYNLLLSLYTLYISDEERQRAMVILYWMQNSRPMTPWCLFHRCFLEGERLS